MRRFILKVASSIDVNISTWCSWLLLLFLRFLVQEELQMDLKEGPNSSWPTKPCSTVDGWEYDLSGGMYHTIVSEVNRIAPPVDFFFFLLIPQNSRELFKNPFCYAVAMKLLFIRFSSLFKICLIKDFS
jgi:hypothetical protein